jgi:hypothetical protein
MTPTRLIVAIPTASGALERRAPSTPACCDDFLTRFTAPPPIFCCVAAEGAFRPSRAAATLIR